MKVSVVIPAYNEEKYLAQCLSGFKNQEVKANEIIVVDNNSTDRTTEIAQKFKVRVIKEERQGMTYARNRGFDEAKYEIIARCDADSVVSPDWIKRIKASFQGKNTYDAILGRAEYYDLENFIPKVQPFFVPVVYRFYITTMKKVMGHYPLNGPNMALTKKVWNKVREKVCLDDSKVHEDIDLSIHINQAGGKIGYDDKLIVKISARRIRHKPESFFVEYPERVENTITYHYKIPLNSKVLIVQSKIFWQGIRKMYNFFDSSKVAS